MSVAWVRLHDVLVVSGSPLTTFFLFPWLCCVTCHRSASGFCLLFFFLIFFPPRLFRPNCDDVR